MHLMSTEATEDFWEGFKDAKDGKSEKAWASAAYQRGYAAAEDEVAIVRET